MKSIYIFLFLVVSRYTYAVSPFENGTVLRTNIRGTLKPITEAPYMAVIRVKNQLESFAAAAIITKRYLLCAARFLILTLGTDKEVVTGTPHVPIITSIKNIYQVKNCTIHRRIGIIEIDHDIIFDQFRNPIMLLKRNVLNLDLQVSLRRGSTKLELIGYEYFRDSEKNEAVNILTSKSLYEKMEIRDLTNEIFKIENQNDRTYNYSRAFLIIQEQLAGVPIPAERSDDFLGDFAGIPYYYHWISTVVGYSNLREAFYERYGKE